MDSGDQHLRESVRQALVRGERILLSGGAGTGKTFFVRRLARDLAAQRVVTGITASTGLAATLLYEQIGGAGRLYLRGPSTLHSAALLPRSDDEDRSSLINGGRRRLQDLRVLIVDEISMTDRLTFERLLKRLPARIGVLAVGDFYQLPPVRGNELNEPDFIFSSPAFKSFRLVELTGNHRQDEPDFIDFLQKLRNGALDREYLEDICETVDVRHPVLFGTVREARMHNANQIAQIDGEPFVSDAKVRVGDRKKALQWFENHTRAMQRFVFKYGMRVMCVQNLGAMGKILIANGDLGTITEVGPMATAGAPQWIAVAFDRLRQPVRIEPYEFKRLAVQGGTEQTVLKVVQFPLMPAYGLTVHKAQGLTLDIVNIDGARVTFAAGQVYVAVSRCRTKAGLRICNGNFFNAFTRPQVEEYYRSAPRFEPVRIPSVPSPAPKAIATKCRPAPATPQHPRTTVPTPPKPRRQPPNPPAKRPPLLQRLWSAFFPKD
jgi:ATP-dependent DNA helicase PIF1